MTLFVLSLFLEILMNFTSKKRAALICLINLEYKRK